MLNKLVNSSSPSFNSNIRRFVIGIATLNLLFCFLCGAAYGREYTYEKFGFSIGAFVDYSGRSRVYKGDILFSTPAETCNGIAALLNGTNPNSKLSLKACPVFNYDDILRPDDFTCG
jgi:hypothetical protein